MWLSCEASLDFVLLVDPRGSKLCVKGLMEKLKVLSNTCNLITYCFKENNSIIQQRICYSKHLIYINNSWISQVKYKLISHYDIQSIVSWQWEGHSILSIGCLLVSLSNVKVELHTSIVPPAKCLNIRAEACNLILKTTLSLARLTTAVLLSSCSTKGARMLCISAWAVIKLCAVKSDTGQRHWDVSPSDGTICYL